MTLHAQSSHIAFTSAQPYTEEPAAKPNPHPELDMLVIQFGDRTLKGHAAPGQWPPTPERPNSQLIIRIKLIGSDRFEPIPLEGAKAIFRVKTFEGKGYDDLRFHDHLPIVDCLWVRITFRDREVMEGLVSNNQRHVLEPGFVLSPVDPDGNNSHVFVLKSSLDNFEVLGLRASPKSLKL